MADDDIHGHGGGGTIDIPKVGPVKKRTLYVTAGVAGAFVLWRYWQASRAASADAAAADSNGDGYADAGTLPQVAGQGGPIGDGSGGSGSGAGSTSDSYGFNGTTNSQWSQYAITQLSGASDKWSYGTIAAALGQFLANKPLTGVQTEIVQAAIAVAGPPPEGTHPVIPGGSTPILVAPTGLKVLATTTTSVTLGFNPVAGAGYYRAYRSGASTNVGSTDAANHSIVVSGLHPGTSYSFQVAADTTSGLPGPKSASVKATTKAVSLAKPGGLKVSQVTKTTARVACTAVKGAESYRWYIGNVAHGSSDGPSYVLQGLRANTAYKVSVAADTTTGEPGPKSAQVSFRTKK